MSILYCYVAVGVYVGLADLWEPSPYSRWWCIAAGILWPVWIWGMVYTARKMVEAERDRDELREKLAQVQEVADHWVAQGDASEPTGADTTCAFDVLAALNGTLRRKLDAKPEPQDVGVPFWDHDDLPDCGDPPGTHQPWCRRYKERP